MSKVSAAAPSNHVEDDSSERREIVITRLLDAPRELVFKAFTDPAHIAQWWGPRGFTNTIHAMDVRPGGVWRFIMHGPDGVDYNNVIVYREIVAPERISYSHGAKEDPASHYFESTITFEKRGNQTQLTLRLRFPSAAQRDHTVEFGAVEGGSQTLDRLAQHLGVSPNRTDATTEDSAAREFVIVRIIAAPRAVVFNAWIDPIKFAQWWGHDNFTNPVCETDPRPGGAYRIVMRSPEGIDYPFKGVYREVLPPSRLVMTGDASEHPAQWQAEWELLRPAAIGRERGLVLLMTVTFADDGGRTLLTVRLRFDSRTDRDAAVKMGVSTGWPQSLARLQAQLNRA